MKRWLLLGMGTLTLGACLSQPNAEERQAGEAPASPPPPGVVASIQPNMSATAIWMQQCASCHGQNGEGGGAGTPSLLTRDKFDQKWDRPFYDTIKNGKPEMGMVAFGPSLSEAQIWGQVVHIRELQGRALRAQEGSPRPTEGVYRSQRAAFRVEEVVPEGQLRTPWGMDWLPDGTLLVTNRPGPVMAFPTGGGTGVEIEGIPQAAEIGQGGMMEVAVHPDYAQNGWVYLAYTEPAEGEGRRGLTKLVRGKLARTAAGGFRWTGQQTLWRAPAEEYTGAGVHFGTRIVFDRGYVYFGIGDRARQDRAQQLDTPNGKVFRLHDDGRVPADNPFAGQGRIAASVWSYGHRNPQGIVKGLDGRIWNTEHGPRGGDELNEVVKGANYGWPVVSFSINYNDQPFNTPWPAEGQNFRMPIFRWLPSIGACGLDVARGDAFPEWRGDLLAGGLVGQNLDRIRVKDGQLVEREELIHGLGRIRDVSVHPNGAVYIALNQPDKVIRLVPAR